MRGMLRRLVFLSVLFAYSTVQAQPVVRSASVDSIRSIIVKFRSVAAMSDSSVLAELRSISASSDIMRPVFQRPVAPRTNSVQSISTDTIGLNRIMQIPLREGITVQDAVREFSSRAEFEYVEPNYRYHIQSGENVPNDPLFSAQWWLENVHAPEAWQITEGDSTIHIGFVDTGVNWLHPDLQFQFAVNPAEDINHDGLFEAWPSDSLGVNARGDTITGDLDGKDHDGNGYANDVIGYNFVSHEEPGLGEVSTRNPIPYDEPGGNGSGHGTAMAGILAAQQDNNVGVSGIAPKCKLVPLRAFNADGTGEDNDIASAIVYAADNHVQILSLSFGDIIPSLLQRDAIRYAVSKGVTIFGSSGNDGSTSPNYPSDFDEVVSVGASPRSGFANFTTHGQELDVVAPGQEIYTTWLNDGYTSVSGTSAASPIAAGIAALLLSKNPKLSPIQLRSIIESTTQPLDDRSFTANGQVDAYAALSYPGSAAIKMVTPHTLDEFHIGDTIHITGSAMSTLFTGYSLSWSKDYQKDSLGFDQFGNQVLIGYDSIGTKEFDTSNSQVLNGMLGMLDTHGLDSGIYSIIFAVGSSDNRSTQERCNIRLESSAPKFVLFSVDSIWVNTERGLLIQATSNIPAQLDLRYAAPGAKTSVISDDKIGFEHAILIQREQAQANVPLSIDAILRTPNGDSSVLHTSATILNEAVPEEGFIEKPYSLPPGFALDSVLSLPVGDQVIETPSGGMVTAFQFDSTQMKFRAVDSIFDPGLPRALGSALGDSLPELLVQGLDTCTFGGIKKICGSTRVYRQNAAHSLLGDLIFENDTAFGSTFARLLGGQTQQFVGAIDSAYYIWNQNNGQISSIGSMTNSSPIDPYNTSNFYSEPHAAHADLRGNGTDDLITLDDDADLIVYERDTSAPTGFRAVFIDSNVAQSNGAFVTAGDFDGDGKPDIAFAFHPVFQEDTLDEYHPAYWTLKVLRNLGDMKFAPMTVDHFYGSNQNDHFYLTSQTGSIGRITNVTGHAMDDLAVSFFPNFYLIEFDSSTKEMQPIWRYPISQSPRGALSWDFDKNGKREFGFFTGDSIHFFEHSAFYTEQTPAPAGLNVSPRDTNRVDLEWAPVEGATEYYILRAGIHDLTSTVIGSTASTFYSDTTVSNGDDWIYSVAAFAPSYSMPNSAAAFSEEAIVHPMPRLVSASMQSQNSVRVRASQQPRSDQLFGGTIMVDDTLQPDAIAVSLDSELVMNLPGTLTTGEHRMRVTSFNLRDIYNSPFDTADYLAFQVPPDTAPDLFYIVRWTFEQGSDGIRIHVIFNEQPDSSALDVLHYTLTPYGTLTSVSFDSANSNALYINVEGVKLIALGIPFVLCVTNIESVKNIPLDPKNGNCAGISLTEPDLSSIMVYPNPAKVSGAQLTFARLTAQADIRIYTMNMRLIRHLTTTESQGGVTWDLRDDAGKLVPSGEYLYFATGTNDAGVSVEGKAAKFVIVNDQK